ncbi:hypothetical protein GVAV_003433 [Gurleya vavrai]
MSKINWCASTYKNLKNRIIMQKNKISSEDNVNIEIQDFVNRVNEKGVFEVDKRIKKREFYGKIKARDFDNGNFYNFTVKKERKERFDCKWFFKNEEKVQVLVNFFEDFNQKLNQIIVDFYKDFKKNLNQDSTLIRLQNKSNQLQKIKLSQIIRHEYKKLEMINFYTKIPDSFFYSLKITDLKKILGIEKIVHTGKLFFNEEIINIENTKEEIYLHLKDDKSQNIMGIMYIPLQNITKNGNYEVKAKMTSKYVQKEFNLNVKFIANEIDFLGKNFTDWCTLKITCDLKSIFDNLLLFSKFSNISISKICLYFIELQMKLYIVNSKIFSFTIVRSLFYYNFLFIDENFDFFFDTFLSFLESKIFAVKEISERYSDYVNLYIYINFLLKIKYRIDKKEIILQKITQLDCDKKSFNNIENKFYNQAKEKCTTEILKINKFSIACTIKNIFEEINFRYKLDFEFLIDKEKIKNFIQKKLDLKLNDKEEILKIIYYIILLEKLFNEKITNIINDIVIKNLYKNVIVDYLKSFCDIIKIVFKDQKEEEETLKEIKYLYNGLNLFIENQKLFMEYFNDKTIMLHSLIEFTKNIMDINNYMFNRMHKKYKKGINKNKIIVLNYLNESFGQLKKILDDSEIDAKSFIYEFYAREREEINRMVNYYLNRIKKCKCNISDLNTMIKYILSKGCGLNKKSFKSFRIASYNIILGLAKDFHNIDEIKQLGKNFYSKNIKSDDAQK